LISHGEWWFKSEGFGSMGSCRVQNIPLIQLSALYIDSAVNNDSTKSKLLGEEANKPLERVDIG